MEKRSLLCTIDFDSISYNKLCVGVECDDTFYQLAYPG